MKSKLAIANNLIEPHLASITHRGKGPVVFIKAKISGVEFERSIMWWAKYKSIVDPAPITYNVLCYRLYGKGNKILPWSNQDAIDAWGGETRKAFNNRKNKVPPEKIRPPNDMYFKFATMSLCEH
jgi:hypothetical protein